MTPAAPQSRPKQLSGKMKSLTLALLRKEIAAAANPERAKFTAGYFKTAKGEYGEGDKFLGIATPRLHQLARLGRGISLADMLKLLHSAWHEERSVALLMMVDAHDRAAAVERRAIHEAYLANAERVNNWDLVDLSAPELVGSYIGRDATRVVERLAKSNLLWERRIAIVATHHATRRGDLAPALLIAERLLDDKHDLIHKAVGWMLREVGKRSPDTLSDFLSAHASTMPSTALRYSIERFTPDERKHWMNVREATTTTVSLATVSSRRPRRSAKKRC